MGLEKEIDEFEKKKLLLEMLPNSINHHDAIQNFLTLSTPLVTDWSNVSVSTDLLFQAQSRALAPLKKKFGELMELPEIKEQFTQGEREALFTLYFRQIQKVAAPPSH